MITGVHTMFYSVNAEADRAFMKDVLGFNATDVGGGWMIFDLPQAEMGFHPTQMAEGEVKSGDRDISFYCDNIEETVTMLQANEVEILAPVEDHGYGLVTYFKMPGGYKVQLFQPRYTLNRE